MRHVRHHHWVAPLAAGMLLAACGPAGHGNSGSPSSAPSGSPRSGALHDAADRLDPFLRRNFPDTYSGLTENAGRNRITIFRKPDPRLDSAARRRAPHVDVEFRNAAFSLREMRHLADRVMHDHDYWRTRGIDIQLTGPKSDGSGIKVGTPQGTRDQQRALTRHYRTAAITVVRAAITPDAG